MIYDRIELENGLEVLGERNPDAKSMALGYFVRTGARDETPEISGVSHFLEHMVFKGTESRAPERVNLEFDEIGAKYNAFTSDENTVYYGAVLPEHQSRLLGLFGDLMRPSLREEDFNTEKKVILEEIAMYEDRPTFTLMDKTQEWFFGSHPLANSVLGTPQTITDLQRDQMLAYFNRRYAPNNIKLVLAGNYDWESAVEQAREITRDWRPDDTPREIPGVQPQTGVRVERTDKFNRVHLCWIAPGYSEQDERRYAADVASYAIGARRGSRYYWALTEPGIADSAWFDHYSKDGVGMYTAYASCDPAKAQPVADLMRNVLREAQDEGLTEAEVNGARRKLAAGRTLHAESPMGRLMSVGMNWVYRREVMTLDDEIDRTLAVTAEEANAILRALPLEQSALMGMGPLEELQ
ncbi:MAG: insulinase family protein [Armatimonadetes bacterium]|nr:insulinase family protein [Armatimonadota bacterium]